MTSLSNYRTIPGALRAMHAGEDRDGARTRLARAALAPVVIIIMIIIMIAINNNTTTTNNTIRNNNNTNMILHIIGSCRARGSATCTGLRRV